MHSVQTAIVQNEMHFAFNSVSGSEKFEISETTRRAKRHHKQYKEKLCNTHYKEKKLK